MQLKKGQVGCNTKKFNNFNLDKFWSLSLPSKVFKENCEDCDCSCRVCRVLSDDITCKHCTRMKDVLSSDYIV